MQTLVQMENKGLEECSILCGNREKVAKQNHEMKIALCKTLLPVIIVRSLQPLKRVIINVHVVLNMILIISLEMLDRFLFCKT